MALKFFGANRMAAQQDAGDAGTSLVSRRPSWGMGPKGMPGAHDYDPTSDPSPFMRRGGNDKPNAYERGGFFWTGNSIAQGTPIAHQDQQLDMRGQANARAWAEQAINDKQYGLNVRNVDARIRQADRQNDLAESGQAMDRDYRNRNLDLSFDDLAMRRDQGQERIGIDRDRVGLSRDELAHRRASDDRNYGLNVRKVDADIDQTKRANDIAERNVGVDVRRKEQERRKKGLASSSPERFLHAFEQYTGQAAYEEQLPMAGSKPIVRQDAQKYINRVDALAMDPRLDNLNESAIAQLAATEVKDVNGKLYAFDPSRNNWFPIAGQK